MHQDARAEVFLVFPLDFGHSEQTIDQILAATFARILSRSFILENIAAFQSAGPVHWRQPSAQVTEDSQESADDPGADFPISIWFGLKARQHLADQFSMMQFLRLNLSNAFPFFAVTYRTPVAPVRQRSSQLAGIRKLQQY